MLADNTEYDLASKLGEKYPGREAYNKLALRNILAGRIALFDYDTSYRPEFSEEKYGNLSPSYPTSDNEPIIEMQSVCEIKTAVNEEVLAPNEVVSFRAPNFRTIMTYPGYVNYFIQLSEETLSGSKKAVAATFETFYEYLTKRSEPIVLSDSSYNLAEMIEELTPEKEALYTIDAPIKYTLSGRTLTKSSSGNYVIKLTSVSYVSWAI